MDNNDEDEGNEEDKDNSCKKFMAPSNTKDSFSREFSNGMNDFNEKEMCFPEKIFSSRYTVR